VTQDLRLEIDNQANNISNNFKKPDTFIKSNHLFQHTSSRISSRFHTFILIHILILSSCILSSPSWDLFRSDCPTQSLCAFLIFSMRHGSRSSDPSWFYLRDKTPQRVESMKLPNAWFCAKNFTFSPQAHIFAEQVTVCNN